MAHIATAEVMALIPIIHAICLAMYIGIAKGSAPMFSGRSKTCVIIVAIAISCGSFYYYVQRRNGEAIVRRFYSELQSKTNAIIGALIICETLGLPLVSAMFVVILHPLV
jgi:hypothetical protein